MALVACTALLAIACAPWWPTVYSPYSGTPDKAIECIEQTLRDQRYRSGERWELFQHHDERFTRWRHKYPNRQRQEPMYLGTYDEITVDALDGRFRINARGWHWYGSPWKGYHEEQKAPGPAAHRIAAQVEAQCS